MLVECFQILVAALLVAAVGVPTVVLFDKWNKEMESDGDVYNG